MITEKLATLKVMHKTNVAYLYFDTYISWYRNKFCLKWPSCLLFSADATRLEYGYPWYKRIGVFCRCRERVRNSYATCISHTMWHEITQPSTNLCLMEDIQAETCFTFEKARVLVCLLCLMLLWTMFGLPSTVAYKNLCTDIVCVCVCVQKACCTPVTNSIATCKAHCSCGSSIF